MQVDLIELLSRRRIAHPSRVISAALRESELVLILRGWPWWREAKLGLNEGDITFRFTGVADGWLDLTWIFSRDNDEALDPFDVSSVADHEWAQPNTFEVYCNGPLPDPLGLYAKVEDYLWGVSAPKGARDFLNVDCGVLSRFVQITASSSYLVARGPERIRKIVCDELGEQRVPYNVLTHSAPPDNR